jgi:hypothetical protein
MMQDRAVGQVRTDKTEDRAADEPSIRELAEWNRAELAALPIVDAGEAMPTLRLIEAIHRNTAAVLITPSVVHPGGRRRAVEETRASILCGQTVPAPAERARDAVR